MLSETPRRYTVDVVNFDEPDSIYSERRNPLTIDTGYIARKQSPIAAGTIRSFSKAPSEVSGNDTPYSHFQPQSETFGRIRKVAQPIFPDASVIAPSTRQVTLRDRFMSMRRLKLAEMQREALDSSIQSFSSDMQELFHSGRRRLRQIEASYSTLI